MELKEFISKTLSDITEGTRDALIGGVQVVGHDFNKIDFDISVTTVSSDNSEIKAGIFVTSIGLGANTSEENQNELVSRIKFTLPIAFHPHKHRN